MDWSRDEVGLSESLLENVFRYAPDGSTVLQILKSKKFEIEISSLKSEGDWDGYLDRDLPSIDANDDSGLVLLLAKRTGEPAIHGITKVTSNDWERLAREKVPEPFGGLPRAGTFSALSGAPVSTTAPSVPAGSGVLMTDGGGGGDAGGGGGPSALVGGRRGVRTLPFSRETFRRITESFHTHASIARVISRTDVPVFSAELIQMAGESAYVYNCRTSNAWEMDLALSATYFPRRGRTLAILYGCPFSIEKDIIRRLARVRSEALHPLLMPGIFAELEAARHKRLVQASVAKLETRIFELNVPSDGSGGWREAERTQRRNIAKRTAYLDTAYLRNGLVSWGTTQLGRMVQHASELEGVVSGHAFSAELEQQQQQQQRETAILVGSGSQQEPPPPPSNNDAAEAAGRKIQLRLIIIRDEYDDWIRDCTMRVDGMAMATQWAQGETNVEIAIATKRDSKHMRSIALLTMVFLPGTFLATIFSMTFFNWSGDAGTSSVSTSIWIYVVLAIAVTLITILAWYYFVIWRPTRRAEWDDDEEEAGDDSGAAVVGIGEREGEGGEVGRGEAMGRTARLSLSFQRVFRWLFKAKTSAPELEKSAPLPVSPV